MYKTMDDHCKMKVKELKELLKKCKKVHGKSVSKMSKPEMVKLAGVMKEHKKMASLPSKEFEKHVEEMRKMRALHLDGDIKHDEKKEHRMKADVKHDKKEKKEVSSQAKPHMKDKEVHAKPKTKEKEVHAKPKTKEKGIQAERKKGEMGSQAHIAPIMKSQIIQAGEDDDIKYAFGKPVKVEKFTVEKELKDAMTSTSEPKAKRVLSAEHLAKMKAGREAKKAERADERAIEKETKKAEKEAEKERKKAEKEEEKERKKAQREEEKEMKKILKGKKPSDMAGGGGEEKNM